MKWSQEINDDIKIYKETEYIAIQNEQYLDGYVPICTISMFVQGESIIIVMYDTILKVSIFSVKSQKYELNQIWPLEPNGEYKKLVKLTDREFATIKTGLAGLAANKGVFFLETYQN